MTALLKVQARNALVVTILVGATITGLIMVLPEYDDVLATLVVTPILSAVIVSRYYVRKGIGSQLYIVWTLPEMVFFTIFAFYMADILLMSHPGVEYAMWRYAATGSLITTVMASLIALPDIVTTFKSVFKHGQPRKADR